MQFVLFRLEKIEEAAHATPITFAVDDCALLRLRKLIERSVDRNAFRFRKTLQLGLRPFVLGLCKWIDGAFAQAQSRIWNHEIEVEPDRVAESLARRTRAEGVVETEETRLRCLVNCAVVLAFEAFGKTEIGTRASGALGLHARGVRTHFNHCLSMSFAETRLK